MIDDKVLDDYVDMIVKGIVGEDNKEEVTNES
jgi:hypothetical protein